MTYYKRQRKQAYSEENKKNVSLWGRAKGLEIFKPEKRTKSLYVNCLQLSEELSQVKVTTITLDISQEGGLGTVNGSYRESDGSIFYCPELSRKEEAALRGHEFPNMKSNQAESR